MDDPEGVSAILILPLIVGDPEYRDYPPSFTSAEILIEAGEAATTFDLRGASSHPNPAIRNSLTYTNLTGTTSSIQASITGGEMTVSAPFGVQPGETAELHFKVVYADFYVPGTVTVRVVASTRPVAQPADDTEPEGRMNTAYTIPVLANDFNPFADAGQPLRVVGARFDGDSIGASVSYTSSNITVTTGSTKSGTINVIYTVRDATDTADREVEGRAAVIVASEPDPVQEFSVARDGSGTISVHYKEPPSSNGASITSYTIHIDDGSATGRDVTETTAGTFSISGLTNGVSYPVSVGATNKVGTTWTVTPLPITPYGTPTAPKNLRTSTTNGGHATSTITASWDTPEDTGGGTTTYYYHWGSTGTVHSTTSTSRSLTATGEGWYTFYVKACNPANMCSGWVSIATEIKAPKKS